jgi:5-methylcytosine-specific restriction protein A
VTPAHAVDHITPKAKGGTDDLHNLQAICRACHLDKTLRDNGRRVKRRIGVDGWPIQGTR